MNKRITNKEIMEAIMNLNNTLSSLDERVTKLESGSSSAKKSASTKSAPKTSNKKSSGKSAPKSSKVNLADFEPKKDADGNYNWASYKACRRRYVEEVSGKTLHGKDGEWLEGETFKKLATPFDKAYKYVKKSDR